MPVIDINWNPRPAMLRLYGVALMVVLGLLGWWLHSRGHGAWAAAAWTVGPALAAVGLLRPSALRPLYVTFTALALPINWALSHVLIAGLYYLVMVPVALAMKVLGYDPLDRKLDPQAESYWSLRKQPPDDERYFRQF